MVDRVGVLALLDVDAALAQPEYRAAEDTFATWWRAARWTGDARIFLESAQPAHPAVVALTKWDPDVLYRAEAARRRELGYPPFAALARIDVPADRAIEVAKDVAAAGLEALGPVEKEGRTVVVARARNLDGHLSERVDAVRVVQVVAAFYLATAHAVVNDLLLVAQIT